MAIDEGPRAFFYGVVPGVQRQMILLGIGNGMYVPLRDFIIAISAKDGNKRKDQTASLLQKLSAGFVSASIGVVLGNPFEVVKVRLQT